MVIKSPQLHHYHYCGFIQSTLLFFAILATFQANKTIPIAAAYEDSNYHSYFHNNKLAFVPTIRSSPIKNTHTKMFARLSSISPLLIGRNYLSQRYVSLPFVNRWRDESTQKNNIGITHKLSMSPMVDENNPTEDNKEKPIVRHYCFLVHGWMGNDSEMSFIETSMQEEIRKRSTNINSTPPQRIEFMIHKTVCNNGNTSDGIANGGTRLAKEIQEVISSHDVPDSNVEIINTISFIGNSLGGLYARYAIGVIHSEDSDRKWHFNVFCTTGELIISSKNIFM